MVSLFYRLNLSLAQQTHDIDLEELAHETGEDLRSYYQTISYELSHKDPNNADAQHNMQMAIDLLNSGEIKHSKILKSLRLFIAMDKVVREKRCDTVGYAIIEANDTGAMGDPHRINGGRVQWPNRADLVIYEYAKKHAQICANKNDGQMLKEKIHSMDVVQVYRATTLTDSILELNELRKQPVDAAELFDKVIKSDIKMLDQIHDGSILYKIISLLVDNKKELPKKSRTMTSFVRSMSGHNHQTKEKQMRHLFDKYLVEPCKYFVDQLKPEVFGPATFDAEFYHVLLEGSKNDPEFYLYWARYKLCSHLVDQQNALFERRLLQAPELKDS